MSRILLLLGGVVALLHVAVVWAQTEGGIRGFLVPTDSAGFSAPQIQHKLSLRASTTGMLEPRNENFACAPWATQFEKRLTHGKGVH